METIRWRLNGQPGKRSAGGRRETNRWRPSRRNVAHVLEVVGLADVLLMAADVPAAIRLLAHG